MADDKRRIIMNFAEGLNIGQNDEKELSNAVDLMEEQLEQLRRVRLQRMKIDMAR